MEDFYEILVFQRLLSKLFEPEATLPIEAQLQEITRQVAWEYSHDKSASKGNRIAHSDGGKLS